MKAAMQRYCTVNPVVEADGSVYPCDFYVLDEYCFGSLHRHSFEEILHSEVGWSFCRPSFFCRKGAKIALI